MKNIKERNNAIDFLRGCACIFIILIHTAWWSGTRYLPRWFSNLFLFIDVPVFIFISGISYNYFESIVKNIKNILRQWNKWVFFLIFYVAIIFIFFRSEFDAKELLNYIFYQVPDDGSLQVVGGSIWFVTTYIKVSIFSTILLHFYKKYNTSIEFNYILIFMILISMLDIPFIDTWTTIYSFVYLLGYYSYNNKITSLKQLIVFETLTIILINIISLLSGYYINDIQRLKFPPTLYYLAISMPGLLLVWFLKDRLRISKKNWMCYLGKNAIFFYYSQGISSSLLYFIEPKVIINNIYIKFIVLAIINIIMGVIFGIILNELYKFVVKLLNKIKSYICPLLN